MRILIEGAKVQRIGYRMFLLEKAITNRIGRIYARNLEKNKVEVLLDDEERKIERFYAVVQSERPKGAKIKEIKIEPYQGDTLILSTDQYFQILTLEQLGKGREEIIRFPRFVNVAVASITSSLAGINSKFDDALNRFDRIGDSVEETNRELSSVEGKLTGIDEKLDKLPERIAGVVSAPKKRRP